MIPNKRNNLLQITLQLIFFFFFLITLKFSITHKHQCSSWSIILQYFHSLFHNVSPAQSERRKNLEILIHKTREVSPFLFLTLGSSLLVTFPSLFLMLDLIPSPSGSWEFDSMSLISHPDFASSTTIVLIRVCLGPR